MDFQLPYGEKIQHINLPDDLEITEIVPQFKQVEPGIAKLISDALKNPLSEMPLELELRKGERTTIVLPSQWRLNGIRHILPKVLEMVSSCGISSDDINLLLAYSHDLPPASSAEVKELQRVSGCKVSVFDPNDSDSLVHVGKTLSNIDVFMAKSVILAERLILIDAVVPNFLTGYSGPPHLLVPGCVGRFTIEQLNQQIEHIQIDQLSNYFGFGHVENNQYSAELAQILKFANVDFIVAAIIDAVGRLGAVYAGDLLPAYEKSCELVREVFKIKIAFSPQLIILASGGSPYDLDLRTSLGSLAALNNLELCNVTVVLYAQYPHGLDRTGQLSWERFSAIINDDNTNDLGFDLKELPIYLLRKLLKRNNLILVSDTEFQLPPKRFQSFPNHSFALDAVISELSPKPAIWIIPNARYTWLYRNFKVVSVKN